jgi:hypothetical protein
MKRHEATTTEATATAEKSANVRTEKWFVEPDGKGKFNAVFEMFTDGTRTGRGAALSGISKAEAEAHVAMAQRNNAERAEKMRLTEGMFDKRNWKMPTKRKWVGSFSEAEKLKAALAYFCGGAEVQSANGGFNVGSFGYYHYVGA